MDASKSVNCDNTTVDLTCGPFQLKAMEIVVETLVRFQTFLEMRLVPPADGPERTKMQRRRTQFSANVQIVHGQILVPAALGQIDLS